MRTTVTIDPDVAKILDGLQQERGQGLSEVLNDIVRSGVTAPARRPRFVQRTTDLGAPTVPLDCTGGLLEFLDQAEVRAAGGKP